jgi:hypothetical protein
MTAHPLIGEVEGTDLSSGMAASRCRALPGAWPGPFGMLEQGGADGSARGGKLNWTYPDLNGR